MRNVSKLFVIFILPLLSCKSKANVDLTGNWIITQGQIFPNARNQCGYLTTNPDYIIFNKKGTLAIRSGIFYQTVDFTKPDHFDDEGESFPFVYFGHSTSFEIQNDSIRILYPPYNQWINFKIEAIDAMNLKLVNKQNVVLLNRSEEKLFRNPFKEEIEYFKVRVLNNRFGVLYELTLFPNDNISFKGADLSDANDMPRGIKLEHGYFNYVLQGFSLIDLSDLNQHYKCTFSDCQQISLVTQFKSGKAIITNIEGTKYPRKLDLAILPIIFAHQKYIYHDLKPVKFWKD